jgi:hypothetical protein
MAAALSLEAAYAIRNIEVTKGKLVVAQELHGDLCNEGYSASEIELALPRALDRSGGSGDAMKILRSIRWALSYVRQDQAKSGKGTAASARADALRRLDAI